ncbi:energy transducer TonB [Aeromonas sp. MdU4]|uniref:energy transducer TonB n=1 Tax=Aeromonas sp. MdU4 TaxID=3342819 RepID=UPI0035B93D71
MISRGLWLGAMLSLLLGCTSRPEVAQDRTPIAIPLDQLSRYWIQDRQFSFFGEDEPEFPVKPVKGYVEVRYLIDSNGRPIKPVVVAAEPPGELEQSALATLSRMRYSPGDDNPDAVPVEVTNRFDIEIN